MDEFQAIKKVIPHARPALQFLGDIWEFDIRYIKLKNLFLGMNINLFNWSIIKNILDNLK